MPNSRTSFKKILITGGAGFIGSNFVRLLLEGKLGIQSEKIVVVDLLTYASNLSAISKYIDANRIDFVLGDVSDSKLILDIAHEVDLIINFAAESHVDRSIIDSTKFIETNVLGVHVLLEAVRKNGVNLFFQVSTDEVYGSIENGSWNENFPLAPNSPYSASKAAAELLVLAYAKTHSLNVLISRCCNNYGPYQNLEKFIPTCINSLIESKKIPIYGNGKQVREWIHVEDHCKAIGLIIAKGEFGEVYNVGSGQEFSNIELARLIAAHFGKTENFYEHVQDRKAHDFRYSLNFDKVKKLGFNVEKNYNTEIASLIRWYYKESS